MRVCMLNDNFYRGSGITLAIRRIVQSPAFANIDVYLAGCEKIGGKKSLHEDTTFVPLNHYRFVPLMEGFTVSIPALIRFARWLRKMRFDVIHVHHRRLAVLANIVRPFSGVPVLFTGHLTFSEVAWFRELIPRRATGVSPSVVDYLRRATKATEVTLIYNPVEFEELEFLPRPNTVNRAVAIGRLDPVKGYDTLIEAWCLLKQSGISAQLDIFGEGSLREALSLKIQSLGLEHDLRLCGFASNVAQLLSGYSFNILVSQKEGFPNAVVEAAAHGIPTLLTDVDGSRDALPPGACTPKWPAVWRCQST